MVRGFLFFEVTMNRKVDPNAAWISGHQVQTQYGIFVQKLHNLVVEQEVRVHVDPAAWPSRLYCRSDVEAYLKRCGKIDPRSRKRPARAKV
jgi:hypothetical protein